MTTEGFEPLLEFAYTAKLIFTKENVLELRNSASVLGFKNLDKACFDFLLPKFFDSSKSTSKFQRKQCCKTRCCKAREALATGDDVTDENIPQPSQSQLQEKEQSLPSSMPTEDATGSQNVQSNKHTDYAFLCPKYRKFQIACGKTRPCLDACGIETVPVPLARPKDNCALNCLPFSSNEDCNKSSTWDLASREMSNVSGTDDVGTAISCYSNFEACPAEQSNSLRSIEEIEVAKQLTVMPDTFPTQASSSGLILAEQALNFKCPNWQLDPMALDCPFFQSFGAVGAQLHDVEGRDTAQGSPYVPSNQSGEDSDSVDTEGDSESYSSERLLEVRAGYLLKISCVMMYHIFQTCWLGTVF